MILQRDKEISVWGESDLPVCVSIDGITVSADACDGKFLVKLPAHKAGGPYTLVIENANDSIAINDVYFGEVFLASGQSNMYMTLVETNQTLEECDKVVRIFTPDREWEYDRRQMDMCWADICMENKESISAVASHFAINIAKNLDVPVGILSCAQGASCVCSWVAPETAESEYMFTKEVKGDSWAFTLPFNQNSFHYNQWLIHVAPYTIRGVIWYQGESDAVSIICDNYARIFGLMVDDWRKLWNDPDLPFITVQLPTFCDGGLWPVIRDQQVKAMLEGHNIGMITIGDVGELNDIHPKDKITVGNRLAVYARGMIYGEDIQYKSPLCESATVADGVAVLKFSNAENGLYETEPLAFTVISKDGAEVAGNYEINGDTIRVWADGVEPCEVAFCYDASTPVHLYSSAGIPASSFKIACKGE